MSVAVYSRNLKNDPFRDPYNVLIINSLKEHLSQGELVLLAPGTTPGLEALYPGIRVVRPSGGEAGFWRRLLAKRWAIPRLLKKSNAGGLLLLHPEDALRTRIPQFLLMKDTEAAEQAGLPVLQKLTGIVVSSSTLKQKLVKHSGLSPDRIIVVEGLLTPGVEPLEAAGQVAFKDRVTEGREFFICADAHWSREQLQTLLKAFSRFKKMQQSNWKLVITRRGYHPGSAFGAVFNILDTYKYREDVILFESSGAAGYAAALGAAYAAVTFQQDGGFPAVAGEARVSNVPVIAPASQKAQLGTEVFLFDAADDASLGRQLMELYKNEALRRQFLQPYSGNPVKPAGLELLKKRLLQA